MIAVIRDLADNEPGRQLSDLCCTMLFQKGNIYNNTPGRDRLVYQILDKVGNFIDHFVKPNGGAGRTAELEIEAKQTNLSLTNMAKGIRAIRNRFVEWPAQELTHFSIYLFNNALFIYVSTEDLDDAFRLFTILNDRGIPLSNSDILKARNLGNINDPKENEKWAAHA